MRGVVGSLLVVASLALGAAFLAGYAVGPRHLEVTSRFFVGGALRWAHVVASAAWIGPMWWRTLAAPRRPTTRAARIWRGWAAMASLATGLMLAVVNSALRETLSLGAVQDFAVPKNIFVGIGMWLAILMAFNEWLVIGPRQARAQATGDRVTPTASRLNVLLSGPMLAAMAGAQTLG